MFTTCPPPLSSIPGRTCRMNSIGTTRSSVRIVSSSSLEYTRDLDAGAANDDAEGPECPRRSLDQQRRSAGLEQIDRHGYRLHTDLIEALREPLRGDVPNSKRERHTPIGVVGPRCQGRPALGHPAAAA